MRKTLTALLPLAVAAGAVAGLATPAAAATPTVDKACPAGTAESRTFAVKLTERPDGGNGTGNGGAGNGKWATDAITRTTVLCRATPTEQAAAGVPVRTKYLAVVTDTGTFTTLGGPTLSPGKGKALTAGVAGHITGSFTQSFTAGTDFASYKPYDDKVTYKGAAPATTPDWVKGLFGAEFQTAGMGDYSWRYWTCAATFEAGMEKWTNDLAHDGAGPTDGDITGKACPQPSTSAAPSASTPAGGAGGGGTLPITGSQSVLYAGGAIVLLAAGGGLMLAARRRRSA